jgi:glycerol-3-phosphate dehydrogenase
MNSFSALHRPEIINHLKSKSFDLLIIGGGITGAGIALDAASRGLSVALIEKNDFAFGTSSRSTKLIHGGLRYLKQLEFGLVKEVGSERAVVHRLATHLVIPEKMLLPLSEGKSMGYLLTSIGLKIYDWLAGVSDEDKRRMLSRPQTLHAEPLLKKEGIRGGALYAEYRTDDARLTIEIMKTAVKYGATAINYVRAENFVYDSSGLISGANVIDENSNDAFAVVAKVVVNATGPWVDELRASNNSLTGKRLHLTKGVHLVVSHASLPIRQAIYFEVADGRMIFAIPRGTKTYIGTTDTTYTGSKDDVHASAEDVEYLIRGVNQNFENINLKREHVESSWAGLRPLIHEDGKSASELSRKDEIFQSDSGLISIAGGKLTGYRKMAERVVDMVTEKHFKNRDLNACTTDSILLSGNAFTSYQGVQNYIGIIRKQLSQSGLQDHANYFVSTYGNQTDSILLQARQAGRITDDSLLEAELDFCVEHEMATKPEDFLIRRTGWLYFDIEKLRKSQPAVINFYRTKFNWDEQKVNETTRLLEATTMKSALLQ